MEERKAQWVRITLHVAIPIPAEQTGSEALLTAREATSAMEGLLSEVNGMLYIEEVRFA